MLIIKNLAGTVLSSLVIIGSAKPVTGQDIGKLKERAAAGDAVAQYDLALLLDNGRGVAQDSNEAAVLYRQAAERNVAQAQYRLGYAYFLGRGVPQNYSQSLKWWRKASAQGYAPAEAGLGLSYFVGKGVRTSYVASYFWLDVAASGHLESGRATNVATLRDLVGAKLTSDYLTKTQDIAERWLETAQPRIDPYQAEEDAFHSQQAKASSNSYADQFQAQMRVRELADPNSAASRQIAQDRLNQEDMNQKLPKLIEALLDNPGQSSPI